METIAVYWEDRVKVYGITAKPGLGLGVLSFSAERLGCWSERIAELENSLSGFELVTCQRAGTDNLEFSLVIEANGGEFLVQRMQDWLECEPSAQFTMEKTVDMIFLHGPHFQDRFGIAETAFSALAKNSTPVLLSGCAGTSMYLLFAEGEGEAARRILTDTFLIPTTA